MTTQDLFVFKQERMDAEGRIVGELQPTGIVPTFMDEFARNGVMLDMGLRAPAYNGRRA